MRSIRIPYFKIWYSLSFVIIFLVTFILTLISPADLIIQTISSGRVYNAITIGAVYVLTLVIASFIWASRIYTNRVVLKEIPKSYLPVEKGEVPRKVRRLIVRFWQRSNVIAWEAKPRDVRKEIQEERERLRDGVGWGAAHPYQTSATTRKARHGGNRSYVSPEAASTTWGQIAHPGWSSPASQDLANVHFPIVVAELPNLIEAKALTLAPPDPSFLPLNDVEDQIDDPEIPRDARIAALLQRPPNTGLREYMTQLGGFGLINPPDLADTFLKAYEYARFSTSPLTETEFRDLMADFGAILAGMTQLDIVAVEEALDDLEEGGETSTLSSLSTGRRRSSASLESGTSSILHHKQSKRTLSSVPSELRLRFSPSGSPLARRSRMGLAAHHRASSFGTLLTARTRMSGANTLYHTASNASLRSNDTVERHGTLFVDEDGDAVMPRSSSPLSGRSSMMSSGRSGRSVGSVIHNEPAGMRSSGQLPYEAIAGTED